MAHYELKLCWDCRGSGEKRVLGFKRECPSCNGQGFIPTATYTLEDTQPVQAVQEEPASNRRDSRRQR